VISEESCDSEDWSNDDKFSFDHTNKLHFTIYSQRKQLFQKEIICHNIAVFTVFFDQINEMKSQKS